MDTLSLSLKKYYTHLKNKSLGKNTQKSYENTANQFVNFWGEHKHTQTLSNIAFDLFVKQLRVKKYSHQSVSTKISGLNSLISFLNITKNLQIDQIPSDVPLHTDKKLKILTKNNILKLRNVIGNDFRSLAIVDLLLYSGIKVGEIIEVKLDSFYLLDDYNGIIAIHGRQIAIEKQALKSLLKYLAVRPQSKSNYIFISGSNLPLNIRNLRRQIGKYFKKANLEEVTLFDLRHTFCANALKKGVPIQSLAKIAGHKNLITTQKYLELI